MTRVVVRRARAVGVRTASGDAVEARRAVLADTSAPALFLELLPREALPARALGALQGFRWDPATVKVDWALDAPIPWTAADARRAPVIHVAESVDELTEYSADLARGLIPAKPFLVFGQYSMADATRCPPGNEVAWAYAHVPQRARGDAGGALTGAWDDAEKEAFADRIEARVEALAPGFRGVIRARHVLGPHDLERLNRNLVNGAINGGTAQLHQQLFFRPAPGLARAATPIRGLYLASASAHPGGGVHGAAGAIAARAALRRG